MIDERLEEQAALYAVGGLSEAEQREFLSALSANVELREFTRGLCDLSAVLAGAVPAQEPSPQLKEKLMAQISGTKPRAISLPVEEFSVIPWILRLFATAVAVLCVILLTRDVRFRRTISDQSDQINQLHREALVSNGTTRQLQQTVIALQETNRLANLRIAMLTPTSSTPAKTLAVTLWDSVKQNGVLVAENMKALPRDRDYELWIIDENKQPVAAGTFHMDDRGTVRLEFHPRHGVKSAGKFAVTEETAGGVDSPTLSNLVLASN